MPPQWDHYGGCSIQTLASMLHQVNTWQFMKHYILCDITLLSVNTILTGHTGLLKSLNDARFSDTYKALPYAAKPTAGNGPFYIGSAADLIKNLVI